MHCNCVHSGLKVRSRTITRRLALLIQVLVSLLLPRNEKTITQCFPTSVSFIPIILPFHNVKVCLSSPRRLVFDMSEQISGFNLKTSHVGCAVDKVALGQVYLQALRFFFNLSNHSIIIPFPFIYRRRRR